MSTVQQYLNVSFPGGAIDLTGTLQMDGTPEAPPLTITGYTTAPNQITFDVPENRRGNGGTVTVQCDGSLPRSERCVTSQVPGSPVSILFDLTLALEAVPPPFPSPPSRDRIGLPVLRFGGTSFVHSVYGLMPYFDACLPWLGRQDRQTVYAMKRAGGETHIILQLPYGAPLYDEPDQAYSPDRFPALDATNGDTKIDQWFLDLVAEVIAEGFVPGIHMNELHSSSIVEGPLVAQALQSYIGSYGAHDLTEYVYLSPGWDAIFYSDGDWEPSHTVVPGWAAAVRAVAPNIMLWLEHNGDIPLGEGGGDYQPGGLMQGFDIVAGEYPPWLVYGTPPGDTVWQINARMACPDGYIRPADQPAGDDPNPPNYLPRGTSNPRGRFYYWVFETGMYEWVRNRITVDQFAQQRAYYTAMGCETVN